MALQNFSGWRLPGDESRRPCHDDNAALSDMIKCLIAWAIEPDGGVVRHHHIFVQDGSTDTGPASDRTVIQNNGLLNQVAAVDVHPPGPCIVELPLRAISSSL